MSQERLKRDWELLADVDPCWAILSHRTKKHGRWDIDEFFLTGDREIGRVMESATRLGHPPGRVRALDFGCGLGRATRALAKHFQRCHGVDISEVMIAKAQELNRLIPNCKFVVNSEDHLQLFPDDYFDMVYTNIVLQHIPRKSSIRSYLREFVRTRKENGLLVFQLPSYIPFSRRLQPRRRLYALLRTLGFNTRFLYVKLGLFPTVMNFVPEDEIVNFLNTIGANLLEVQQDSHAGPSIQSRTYYATK